MRDIYRRVLHVGDSPRCASHARNLNCLKKWVTKGLLVVKMETLARKMQVSMKLS